MKKILEVIVIAGLFVSLFIPLIVSSSMFFPYITGKAFMFRVIVEVITGAWLLLVLLDAKYRPKLSWLLAAAFGFVAVIGVSNAFGANPFRSFWSNFERMEGYVTLLHLLAYFVVLTAMVTTERLWNRLFNVALVVSLIEALYGFAQLGGSIEIKQGGDRLDGTLGNPTYLAIYAVFTMFIASWLWWRARERRASSCLRWFYIVVIVINAIILFGTSTRGAIIGLIAGLFVTALALAIRSHGRTRRVATAGILAIVILVGLFVAMRDSAFVQSNQTLKRLASISLTERTTLSRFLVWKTAFNGFTERPILGWGQENFNLVFNEYYDPGMYNQEVWFDRAHNVFFDWLIAGGIIGLLAYLSLFVLALWYVWRSSMSIEEKALWSGLLVAYLVHIFFVFDNLGSQLAFYLVLAFIHCRALASEPAAATKSALPASVPFPLAAGVVTIATIWVLYVVNIVNIDAATKLITGIHPDTPVPAKLETFRTIMASRSFGIPEAREQLMQQALSVAGNSTVSEKVRQEFAVFAHEQMQAQIKETPDDIRPYVLYGGLLARFGNLAEAQKRLEQAAELSPKKQTVLFDLGSVYIQGRKVQEALQVLRRAYELEPNYQEAAKRYAAALIVAGQTAEADKLISPIYGDKLPTDDIFINAYVAAKQYDKLVKVWQEKVAANPENLQYHLSLAAAYLFLGDRSRSINEIEAAVRIDPTFRTQANYLISEIRAGRMPQ